MGTVSRWSDSTTSVMFDHENEAVPIGAFLISRVLPLWHRYTGANQQSRSA